MYGIPKPYHQRVREKAGEIEKLKDSAPCEENKAKVQQSADLLKEVADEVESVEGANPSIVVPCCSEWDWL